MSEQTRYPLCWPEGWPRTAFRHASKFVSLKAEGGRRKKSLAEACEFLQGELGRLKASKEILSTNVKLRLDGLPYSDAAQPRDPGAALYFDLSAPARSGQGPSTVRPVSLACDKWNCVEDNVYAIAKHVEALRGQERWGVGSVEQAFRGYMALPAVGESEASTWWRVLGVPINATPEQVKEAYRLLVRKHHPDTGGNAEMFQRVQRAMERFETEARRGTATEQQKAA